MDLDLQPVGHRPAQGFELKYATMMNENIAGMNTLRSGAPADPNDPAVKEA